MYLSTMIALQTFFLIYALLGETSAAWIGKSMGETSFSSFSLSASKRKKETFETSVFSSNRHLHSHYDESLPNANVFGHSFSSPNVDSSNRDPRRRQFLVQGIMATTSLFVTTTTPNTLSSICWAYTPDSDNLRESLYLISRVQEATVQQERFVRNNKLQEDLKKKMKLTLRLVEKNYRLLDQINYASQFVTPSSEVVTATEAGNIAVEALQGAIDFVNTELGVGPITPEQRTFLTESMQETREQLFVFLKYMPLQKLEEARFRVEDENIKNRDEFDGDSDAGVYNPVILPWKQQQQQQPSEAKQ
mmetsp:Transcript_6528/g.9225  ORF Transcript_6528/g.9225 Transcript_6528/m.9225 type:complete len:305 (+) Transcript_6528:110-1024(+)